MIIGTFIFFILVIAIVSYFVYKITAVVGTLAIVIVVAMTTSAAYISAMVTFGTVMMVYHLTDLKEPAAAITIGTLVGFLCFFVVLKGMIKETQSVAKRINNWFNRN